jgi:8-oxo-dGTP diphosphatase
MEKYVLGFCFSENEEKVLLIEKNRPNWQKGQFNGIGGHIEDNEAPHDAMKREFSEETGILIDEWKILGRIGNHLWCVYIYYSKSDKLFEAKTMTDEEIKIINVLDINNFPVISNLKWLIPICLDKIEYDFDLYKTI